MAAALVVGTGNAFFQPALSGLPVQLAPRDRLGDANALLAAVAARRRRSPGRPSPGS